ncbi:MAG: S8 family serine peptidase, partial [Fimbriimonadaceae bacterium]
MNPIKFTATTILAGIAAVAMSQSAAPTAPYVEGEVLVKYRSGASISAMLDTARIGARSVETLRALQVQRVRVPASMSTKKALDYYRSLPNVEYAEPNYIATAFQVNPNDTNYSSQYALQKISAPQGWTVTTGSSSVVIAIVDTGVDMAHQDLAGKIVPGYDFVNNDTNA